MRTRFSRITLPCVHGEDLRRVSTRDRVIMLLLVAGIAGFVLRPFVALQSYNRANLYLETGFYEAAIKHYKRATVLNRRLAEAHSWLGYAYSKNGELDKAVSSYQIAIRLNPSDSQACKDLGLIYFGKKDFEKAAVYFGKVADLNSSNLAIRNLQAVCYEKAGKPQKAISIWRLILRDDPTFGSAKKNLERLQICPD